MLVITKCNRKFVDCVPNLCSSVLPYIVDYLHGWQIALAAVLSRDNNDIHFEFH